MEIVVEHLPRVDLVTFLEEKGLEVQIRERQDSEGEITYSASLSPALYSSCWSGGCVSVKAAHGAGCSPIESLMNLLLYISGQEMSEKDKEHAKIQIPYFKHDLEGLTIKDEGDNVESRVY